MDYPDQYLDPFYNECRAYGRLVEKKLNGKVAVRCYGYLMLSAQYEEDLEQQFGIEDWNRTNEEKKLPFSKRYPLKAIVKEFVPEDTVWKPRLVGKVLRDLKKIRKTDVYVIDVKAANYKNGLLVDFSVAMTNLYFLFDIKPTWRVERYKNEDLIAFDVMIREQRVKTRIQAFKKRNIEIMKKLRSYEKSLLQDEEDE